MNEIKAKLKIKKSAYQVQVKGQLALPFAARCAALQGEVLRGGDLVTDTAGQVLEVQAQPEPVLHIECPSLAALGKLAYHLGSGHVPVEVGEGYLRIAFEPGVEEAFAAQGAKVTRVTAPFEPEVGTHGAGAGHDHDHHHHDHGHHHDGHDHHH